LKLLILAYTSKNYKSEPAYIPYDPIVSDRADLTRKLPCMDTWVSRVKHNGHQVIFFDGDNNNIEYDEKNQILHLTETDVYDYFYLHHQNKPSNMLKKLKQAVSWVLENIEFDYILRVDDGTYVNSYVLENFIHTILNYDIIWSGTGGGGGIFFSKKACKELLNINNTNHLEDVSIFSHFYEKKEFTMFTTKLMSSFYNLGEKLLTIHYATGKRMYYADYVISNYYKNTKAERDIIINYPIEAGCPLNTNRVSGLNENTGLWYGLDRDLYNWEYYGNYARSIVDLYDCPNMYGDEVSKNIIVYDFKYIDLAKTTSVILELLDSLIDKGELNLVIKDTSDLTKYENILNNINHKHYFFTEIELKEYTSAEYVKKEFVNLVKIIK
jgi:hypothetical protein